MLKRGYFYDDGAVSDTQAAINVLRNMMLTVDWLVPRKATRDRGIYLLFRAKWRLTLLKKFGSMRGMR